MRRDPRTNCKSLKPPAPSAPRQHSQNKISHHYSHARQLRARVALFRRLNELVVDHLAVGQGFDALWFGRRHGGFGPPHLRQKEEVLEFDRAVLNLNFEAGHAPV